jgi:hypothetical protein
MTFLESLESLDDDKAEEISVLKDKEDELLSKRHAICESQQEESSFCHRLHEI